MFYAIAEERDGQVFLNSRPLIAGYKYLGEVEGKGVVALIGNGCAVATTPEELILGRSTIDLFVKNPTIAKEVFSLPLETSEIVTISEWEKRGKPTAGDVLPIEIDNIPIW